MVLASRACGRMGWKQEAALEMRLFFWLPVLVLDALVLEEPFSGDRCRP